MNVSDLELFVRVADCGSLSGAAKQLNISSAVASAGIKRLEKELDSKLFIRSTRQLRLSTPGKQYLRFCRRALAELNEGAKSILSETGLISGQLTLSIPSDFGRNHLLGWIDSFVQDNPLLSLTIRVSDEVSNFYNDRIDASIRYGVLEDSNLIAFRLITTERVLVASPEYINKRGLPLHPEELNKHNCLLFQLGDSIFNTWCFLSQDKESDITVKVSGDRMTNDADIVRRWALSGHGIAFKSRLDVNQEIEQGKLIHILPEFKSPPLDMWLVCPDRKLVTPSLLALKDYLQACLQNWIQSPTVELQYLP